MERLLDKFVLLVLCLLLHLNYGVHQESIIPLMFVICISGLCYLKDQLRYLYILYILYFIAAFFNPEYICYLPFLLYDIYIPKKTWCLYFIMPIPVLFHIIHGQHYSMLFVMLAYLPVICLKYKYIENDNMKKLYLKQRDDSKELTLLLSQKNKDLIINQNQEVHIAILNERNRIAREIHDHVGHLLSSSLLQMGAIATINQQASLHKPIQNIKDTLTKGLDSVRKNVHDLHDDAIDLQLELENLLKEFTFCKKDFVYDIYREIPIDIAYHIIAIVKEALHNTSKHSNAKNLSIVLREQPVFYQLIIQDDGTIKKLKEEGMGLINMKDRVQSMHGYFSVQNEHGFRIFITIPKEESYENRNYR